MSRDRIYLVRDLRAPAVWAKGLLIAQAVIVATGVAVALRHGPGFDDDLGGSAAYALTSALQVLAFVVTGVVVLRWIYLACANVHAFGAEGLGSRPGMAVAWYFVPVACLFLPFQSMREIWKASRDPRDWEAVDGSSLLGLWWLGWVLGNAIGIVAFRLDDSDRFPEASAYAEMLTTASDVLTIVTSLLLARIIGRITTLQTESRQHDTSRQAQPNGQNIASG